MRRFGGNGPDCALALACASVRENAERRRACGARKPPVSSVVLAVVQPPGFVSIVPRQNNNENYVLITAVAKDSQPLLLPLTRRIRDCGCNVLESRLSCLGRDVVIACLVVGSWDAIAKLESGLPRLQREDGVQATMQRSEARANQATLLPYLVEVVAADKPGILHELAEFFSTRSISLEQLTSSRYRAMQTGAEMFSAQITIGVPAKTHIAALRDDFLEFCDALNLDAVMEPVKY